MVDGEANYVDDPSVPPWIAELEALKESGDFFVTQVEAALDVASNHSAKAEQYAASAESSAKTALEQASHISAKVKLATDSAEDSKASAARAFSSAEDARTSYESSVQLAGVMEGAIAEVGAIRDQTAASAAEAKSSETNAGSSASSAKADADRAALAASNSSKSATAADASAKAASSDATKAASSAAKSEQEAVKAVDAASMLNADAKAFGDAVRSGTFKGDTGPANQLDVLETKTVSPNTPASVSITGEAPNQRLSFAIPKGNDGDKGDKGDKGAPGALTNASSYHIVGPGRPDVPSSTAGTITGNEPVGATYYSEDGAGVGAHVWRRRPGGKWEVTDGDTGLRAIGGDIFIQRIQNVVYLTTGENVPVAENIAVIPSDWWPVQLDYQWVSARGGTTITTFLRFSRGSFHRIGGAANARWNPSWVVRSTWPTFPLPGTPA